MVGDGRDPHRARFPLRCVEAAIKAGATTVNIPDTVGYATPEEFAALIRMIVERVPNSDKAVFSTHCHNDLGLAVANSLAGVGAGRPPGRMRRQRARRARRQCRAGRDRHGHQDPRRRHAVLDRHRHHHADPRLEARRRVTAFPVQYNKAIVGRNAFAHESGIHQDGVLKHAETFEIMTPESVGLKESSLVMGKHSGRHAFREKLKELGYELGDNAFEDAFVALQGARRPQEARL